VSTIYALWLRQIKKYLRSKSRMIGTLGQPLLFLLAFGYGFQGIYQKAEGGNYMEFIVPGIVLMTVLFTAVFSGIEVIWDRQFGFLKETLVAPVSRFEILMGRALGGATVSTLQGCLVLAVTLLCHFRPRHLTLLPVGLLFIFLVALLFTSLGLLLASFLEDMQGFQLIMNFLIMPIFFLSGALFPLGRVPTAMKIIAKLDPLTYGIDGLRGALLANSVWGMSLDLIVLCIVTAALLGSATAVFEYLEA